MCKETPAEKTQSVWQELRENKLGVHFRRQQVIAGFIVDFYCHKAGLVVEVDGDIHDLQQEEDAPPPPSTPPPNSTNLEFGGGWVGAEKDGVKDYPLSE